METLPLVGLPAPVEKPVPVQEVALLELHVSVEDWPCVTVEGEAEKVAVGAGGSTTQEFETTLQVPLLQE